MASSGTIYTSYSNGSRFYLKWQVASQSTADNRTKVNWQAGLHIDGAYYWYSNAVKINSIHVNGGSSLGSGTWSNIYGPGTFQLKSGSKWIPHNSDGTKSFSANVSGWLYSFGDKSTSGSWTLPTIPRNSQVTTGSSYDLGDPVVITTNRKSTSFTHTITIRLDNSSGTVIKQINSVGSGTTWTPTAGEITTMQDHIPNSNTLTLHIRQYNNQVGAASTTTTTLNLTEADPTFEDFSFKDTDSTTVGVTGDNQVLVKGQSELELKVASADKMTAIKGASEDRYSFSFLDSSAQEDYAAGDVTSSFTDVSSTGNRTARVTAYDSRNNSTTVSKEITVYDYSAPTILTTLTRENNFDSDTTITIEGAYSPLDIGGTDKNSLTTGSLEYRYKESGGSYGSWTSVAFTVTDNEYEVTPFVVTLDNEKKYEFEFHIDDDFQTVTTTNSVDVGTPIMFVGERSGSASIGINKMPENGALDVGGNIIADNFYPVGSIYINATNSTNPSTLLGFGTWAAFGSGRVPVGYDSSDTDFDTAEETGGAKTNTHNHYTAMSHDGSSLFSTVSGDTPRSRVVTKERSQINDGTTTAGTRQDSTYNETIDTMPPYITVYMWKRTA